jgi:cytochrome c oxidase subunit 1
VSSIGAFIFGFSQLLFVYVIWNAVRSGEKAPQRPWESAKGLDWELPTPAPYHSWETPPSRDVVAHGTVQH